MSKRNDKSLESARKLMDEKNQDAYTWKDHHDINAVSLASSLIARNEVLLFV